MDCLFIKSLTVTTTLGVYDWEQAIKQKIIIDLEMAADIARAAASDELKDALNYAAVASRITEFLGEKRFQLVETLAEQVATLLHQEFKIQWLRMQITKPGAIANASGVGVRIERNF